MWKLSYAVHTINSLFLWYVCVETWVNERWNSFCRYITARDDWSLCYCSLEYKTLRRGVGHVLLFEWSISFLMDSSFLIWASVVVGVSYYGLRNRSNLFRGNINIENWIPAIENWLSISDTRLPNQRYRKRHNLDSKPENWMSTSESDTFKQLKLLGDSTFPIRELTLFNST